MDVDTDQQYFETYKKVLHVELAHWADKILLCPCSANTLSKIANKISDNLVTSTISVAMGLQKLIYICPAMNTNMYINCMQNDSIYQLCNSKIYKNVHLIPPTVDKLICGDFGIGALANINIIHNIVNGYVWQSPITKDKTINFNENLSFCWRDYIPNFNEPGSFGIIRKYDIHTGIDIYCFKNTVVYAVEDGIIVDIGIFTGPNIDTPWWNTTYYIVIKGQSGYILYGELNEPLDSLKKGREIITGESIGTVSEVLPENKIRSDIRNHNNSMLHIELYDCYDKWVVWHKNSDKNKHLLDPTPYFYIFN